MDYFSMQWFCSYKIIDTTISPGLFKTAENYKRSKSIPAVPTDFDLKAFFGEVFVLHLPGYSWKLAFDEG